MTGQSAVTSSRNGLRVAIRVPVSTYGDRVDCPSRDKILEPSQWPERRLTSAREILRVVRCVGEPIPTGTFGERVCAKTPLHASRSFVLFPEVRQNLSPFCM